MLIRRRFRIWISKEFLPVNEVRRAYSHMLEERIQYTKNLEPGDLNWVQHWVKIAGHGHTNHKQALRVHQSKSHQQYFLWKNPKFLSFLTCCFYSLERLLFLSRIFSDTFFLSFLPMLKRWKNCQFLTKTSDNPFGKIPNFWLF